VFEGWGTTISSLGRRKSVLQDRGKGKRGFRGNKKKTAVKNDDVVVGQGEIACVRLLRGRNP